jgi:2-polyprenyl-6-methoxyphenol hydroxylase-like FAD-dependent oxidoreductase
MEAYDLVVAGGGPAGLMVGHLFARAGARTLVIEKHRDFLRDFRGDTVHPSTLALFDELGLLDGLLARPHDRVFDVGAEIGGRTYRIADFAHLPVPAPFIAMMPQWDFLDYLAERSRALPTFSLATETEADGLSMEDGRVVGVSVRHGPPIRARLTIAADGRGSVLRGAAGLPLHDLGAPIDIFWFRVPKARTPDNRTTGIVRQGQFVVLIDRGDYWQCARVIGKGSADAVRDRGIDRFRADMRAAAPQLGDPIAAIGSFDDVKLLSVSLDRLTRWHRPGLLAIGDAAHAMSPVGGVGINLAIQDAVAAANILAGPLADGAPIDPLLGQVMDRRMPAVKIIQGLQRLVHRRVLGPAIGGAVTAAPLPVRLLAAIPLLQRIPARVLGLGIRREHIRSPKA